MKKIILLPLLLISFFAIAQTPVNVSQPQKFLKYIIVNGKITTDSAMAASDSSARVSNTKWQKQNFAPAIGGGYLPINNPTFTGTLTGGPSTQLYIGNSGLNFGTRVSDAGVAFFNNFNGSSRVLLQAPPQSDASYNVVMPLSGGTLALTSDLTPFVPYTGATTDLNLGTHNITAGTGTFTSDLYVGGQAVATRKPIDFYGKKVVIFGDSYTTSTRATNTARGYTQQFCAGVGAIEVNNGAGGTTLEKRSPIDYMASPNMVDRIASIPTYDPSYALLVFQYGLNDLGYNGGSYSAANYITDYTTILNGAIAKNWPVARVLLIPPPFIGAVGYASYAGITGQPAPTRARHLDFVNATKTVANTFGTLYIPLFDDQLKNDTTLLDAVAGPTIGIHPTDAGYAFIANDLIKFFGGTLFSGARIGHSTTTPIALEVAPGDFGSNTAGSPANLKLILYNDGTNKAGIGESANNQEYQTYAGGSHNFYVNGTSVAGFGATGGYVKGLSTGANNIFAFYNAASSIAAIGSEFNFNGTNAANAIFYVAGNNSISLGSNGSKWLTINGTGAATFNGSLTVSGIAPGSAGNFVVNGGSGLLATRTAAQTLTDIGGQAALSGTGFVKSTAGTISYDNSTYLTTTVASSTYFPAIGGITTTGGLGNNQTNGGYFLIQTAGSNTAIWSTSKTIFGTGSTTDNVIYGYGTNSFGIATGGSLRLTITGAGAATFSGSVAASNLSLAGNFTTSGAFNTTLTATATTAVTLPTTGTLATLAGSETLTNKTLTSPTINSGSLGASSTATTQPAGDNSTKVATTAYVDGSFINTGISSQTKTGPLTLSSTLNISADILFKTFTGGGGVQVGMGAVSGSTNYFQFLQQADGTVAITETSTQITSGTAAPASTPVKVGNLYIDTNNKKVYLATGASSSADWTIVN